MRRADHRRHPSARGRRAVGRRDLAHCRELIAGYKVPKEIRFVESFPMTATGKILKREVRDQLQAEAG